MIRSLHIQYLEILWRCCVVSVVARALALEPGGLGLVLALPFTRLCGPGQVTFHCVFLFSMS